MIRLAGCWVCLWFAVPASGQTILWNSDPNAANHTSTGDPMDSGFRFELGVFEGAFTPTHANKAEWAARWKAARRTPYVGPSSRFSNSFTPADNASPFAVGTATYIWGFRGDSASGEWILFRAAAWTFPDADPFMPTPPIEWFAKDATAVIGSINPTGIPFLMKSAAVSSASPPPTTWDQWREEHLAGEPLDGQDQDPDHDGSSNLLEFVFGTPPKSAGAPTVTPVTVVGGRLQISIPRRIDHPALLTVQVSGNLSDWQSGPSATEMVSGGVAALVVRDLTAFDSAHPQRFMRLKAEPAAP